MVRYRLSDAAQTDARLRLGGIFEACLVLQAFLRQAGKLPFIRTGYGRDYQFDAAPES